MDYWASIAFLDTDVQLEAARCADELGFAGVAVPDHLFFAQSLKATYPYTPDGAPLWTADMHWPEPWALLSAMAAVTQRVRLSTNIYVAPARDLFTVAKGVSTAAAISHDRVALGVGAGWCEDEFVQTGQDFHTRGKRLDEMLEVLPKLLTGDVVEHHGEFYDFDPLSIAPVPTKPVPVIVGGNSPAAMRRAARVADGWIPAASVKPDDFKPVLAEMRRLRDRGRPRPPPVRDHRGVRSAARPRPLPAVRGPGRVGRDGGAVAHQGAGQGPLRLRRRPRPHPHGALRREADPLAPRHPQFTVLRAKSVAQRR